MHYACSMMAQILQIPITFSTPAPFLSGTITSKQVRQLYKTTPMAIHNRDSQSWHHLTLPQQYGHLLKK